MTARPRRARRARRARADYYLTVRLTRDQRRTLLASKPKHVRLSDHVRRLLGVVPMTVLLDPATRATTPEDAP